MDQYAPIRNLQLYQFDNMAVPQGAGDDWQPNGQKAWGAVLPEGYGSKYQNVVDMGGGRYRVTMQAPGMHKYDTLDAVYQIDPATGMGVMVGDPVATRQVSSAQQLVHDPVDALAKMVGTSAALYGAAYLGGQYLGGGAGSAGAGAGGAALEFGPPVWEAGSAIGGAGGAGGVGAAAGGVGGGGVSGGIASTVPAATMPAGITTAAPATTTATIGGGMGGNAALWRAGGSLAGSLISGAMQGNAAQNASAAQQAAAAQGQASLQGVYERIAQLMQPYVGAGVTALDAQQALIGVKGPEAQKAAIAALESSPEFSSMIKQGEEAILANASATGGLRGGNVQAALGQFRPAMLSRLINEQIGRLSGLSQQGQNAAAGVGNAGVSIGGGIANLMQQQGAAAAGGELARGRTNAGYVNAISQALQLYYGFGG